MFSEFEYSDLVFSITETIDLISPIVANHHKLVAYIAYSLGKELKLSQYEQIELEIAGSLHDVGGLTLLERLDPIEFEYKDSNMHSEKGYLLLKNFKPFSNIAEIIRYHHVKWRYGECRGFDNQEISIGSHILNLSDRVSLLIDLTVENILSSTNNIVNKINDLKGEIFHPKVVEAFERLSKKDSFWLDMKYLEPPNFINKANNPYSFSIEEEDFEDFMKLMSYIVDFKSRFTAAHSSTVAACAEVIAGYLGFNQAELKMIRFAGYIHDLGKLAIPTEILEKPSALSKEEFALIRTHSYHTNRVLAKVKGFEKIRIWGSLHHEKLNGTGYPFGLKKEEIPLGARIMAVADIFTSLRERRPYREPMCKENTINVLNNMVNMDQIDSNIVEYVASKFEDIDDVRDKAHRDSICKYEKFAGELMKSKELILNFSRV